MIQQAADHIDLEGILQDLNLTPATLQASEDARQFLERMLCEPGEKARRTL